MSSPTPRVVVIGGGVLGLSTAAHLLRVGVADVTVVERDRVAQGTSSAGAGFVDPWSMGAPGQTHTGEAENALMAYAVAFYRELHEARPASPYRQRGLIWMAHAEADWSYVEPRLTRGPEGSRALEPAEIEQITHGVVRASGVYRGVLRPTSAQVSADRASRELAEVVRAAGGTVREHSPVQEILTEGDRVTGVRTLHGDLSADIVITAAGAWTNTLLSPLGVTLPMVPLLVSRLVTEPLGLPGDLPLLFLRSKATGLPKSMWLREEDGRLMFGTNYDTPARDAFIDTPVPERLDQVDLDGVLDVQRGAAAIADAIPVLAEYTNLRLTHGAPCYTPDGRAIVGPVPAVEGLHVVAGCNEQGVTHGPGFGRVLAETIVNGASELGDLATWSLTRFGDRQSLTQREVFAALGPAGAAA